MIIVMGSEITDAQINTVVKKIEAAGLKANISRGVERTVIGAIGDERKLEAEMFTTLPGVESAMHIAKQYKIVSRESHKQNTIVEIGAGARESGYLFRGAAKDERVAAFESNDTAIGAGAIDH